MLFLEYDKPLLRVSLSGAKMNSIRFSESATGNNKRVHMICVTAHTFTYLLHKYKWTLQTQNVSS